MRRSLRTILYWTWIGAGLAFTAWIFLGFQAVEGPNLTDRRYARVRLAIDEHGMQFRMVLDARSSGLIFLPGGMVDPMAYAPLARRIAAAGHPVHLLNLPLRCAYTDSQVGQLFRNIQMIIDNEPRTSWILAGHSRGAMLAARFVHENASRLSGLVLIATTHPRDFSLASTPIPVVKIYGTNDGIAPYAKMRQNQHLLPPNTKWIGIQGGNHVQFGYYRHQLGDDEASISRERQQQAVELALRIALAEALTGNRR